MSSVYNCMEIKSTLSCAFTVPKYTGIGWVRDLHGFLVKLAYLCVLHSMCSVTYTLHFLEGNIIVSRSFQSQEVNNTEFSIVLCWGAWDGAAVRALTSHQCGPGSNNVGWVCCWSSHLLREVFLWVLQFSPLFQFDQDSGRRRTTLWMCYLQIIIYLFII